MRRHEIKRSRLNDSAAKLEEAELAECSFHPGLNDSASLLDNKKNDRTKLGTFNLLYDQARQPKERVESLKVIVDSKELEEMREKPQINIM